MSESPVRLTVATHIESFAQATEHAQRALDRFGRMFVFDPLIHSTPARVRRVRITPAELRNANLGFDIFLGILPILWQHGYPRSSEGVGYAMSVYTLRWEDADGNIWVEWIP